MDIHDKNSITLGIEERKDVLITASIQIVVDKLVTTLTKGIEITDVNFQIGKDEIIVCELYDC